MNGRFVAAALAVVRFANPAAAGGKRLGVITMKHSLVLAFFIVLAGLVSANAAILVDPISLTPGSTVSPLPNGGSTGDDVGGRTILYDHTQTFSFSDGLLTGTLRDRVLQYADAPSALHPGLYFDYEIRVGTH